MCPELIKIIELEEDENTDTCHFSVSPKVDVWAVGCVISEMFSGYFPWENKVGKNVASVRKHLKKMVPFPIPENITNEKVRDIIKLSTACNIEERLYYF